MQEVHLQSLWVTGEDDSAFDAELVIPQFPWVIGRGSGCDSYLENPLISRRHCVFFRRGGEVWLQDLGSQNGTSLNGERLTDARPVHDGDRLEVACLPFLVQLVPERDAAPAEQRTSVRSAR